MNSPISTHINSRNKRKSSEIYATEHVVAHTQSIAIVYSTL